MYVVGKARLRTALGMMAVARSVAAGAADRVEQGFLLWLWALMSSDAGHTLTQLDDQAAEEEAHVVCMTEVIPNLSKPVCQICTPSFGDAKEHRAR